MGTTKLLTVDELLKMSEDDYMDERQLASVSYTHLTLPTKLEV